MGTGAETGTGVETRGRKQHSNGDGNGDRNESSSGDRNGDGDGGGDGDEDGIREGGGGATMRKKPQNSCRRDVGNGRNLGGKRKKRRKESVDSVAADPDNVEKKQEAREEITRDSGLTYQLYE